MYMENSEQKVINQVMAYDSSLRQFANSLTLNDEDANDLVQDTYLKVIQFSSKYTANTNLKAWVFTIMKNTFINQYRRKQRAKVMIDQSEDLYVFNNMVSNPSDAADMHYYVSDISRRISAEKEDQRKPFEMFLDGYKYQEIAEEMQLPIGTVKSRIFFTRKKLMENLQDYVTPTFPRSA